MSELKAVYATDKDSVTSLYYPKSEADKVITEKDKELRHQKYKRCLAMADMNWWQANRYSAAEMVERIRGNFEEATQCSKLEEKYLKRYHKWLELAEKFKGRYADKFYKEAK